MFRNVLISGRDIENGSGAIENCSETGYFS